MDRKTRLIIMYVVVAVTAIWVFWTNWADITHAFAVTLLGAKP